MKRHVGTILAAVSQLVCASALWHWAFSSLGTTRIGWSGGGLALISIDGPERFVSELLGQSASDVLRGLRYDREAQHEFLGFTVARGTSRAGPFRYVVVPYWFVVLLTAILPVRWWLVRRRRRGRAFAGRCLDCGYDLRGTPGRCPECGAAAEPRATAAQPTIS